MPGGWPARSPLSPGRGRWRDVAAPRTPADEAHKAAPTSALQRTVDAQITNVIGDVAPRFERRLFLSAKPQNGHCKRFSALLEVLDPQRFTRGVDVTSDKLLEAVIVRHIKRDLKEIGSGEYPDRQLVKIDLAHEQGHGARPT